MDKKDNIGIGLLGLGVVGTGLVQALFDDKKCQISKHNELPIYLTGVLVRDIDKSRLVTIDPNLLTTDVSKILDNPNTDIVVEVLGGEEPAIHLLMEAIAKGKHVVTANKEIVAKYGQKLLKQAQLNHVNFRFEASVGAGIPIISALETNFKADRVSGIRAIINGTTNYILTRMATGGIDFSDALIEAQQLGYAEPDPTNDVEGIDVNYKLSILAMLAFDTYIDPSDIYCEGISDLDPRDFKYADELGYVIKLLAIAKEDAGVIQMRVHPVFLPKGLLLAKVDGVYNAIEFQAGLVGKVLMYGRGAGAEPTASGILGDVSDIVNHVVRGDQNRNIRFVGTGKKLAPMSDLLTSYYLRITVLDQAGVLSVISKVFAKWAISIGSVIQKESDNIAQTAELVILTHLSNESSVQNAVKEIQVLSEVMTIGSLIRVEL